MKRIYIKPESMVYVISTDEVICLETHSGEGYDQFSKGAGGDDMWDDEEDDF